MFLFPYCIDKYSYISYYGLSDSPSSSRQLRTPNFLAESIFPGSIYPESEKKVKNSTLVFWTLWHSQLLDHLVHVNAPYLRRYQSIENIETQNLFKHRRQPLICPDVAGLQREKIPKRDTKGPRNVGQHVPPDLKILLRDPIMGLYILTKFQIDKTLLTPSKML